MPTDDYVDSWHGYRFCCLLLVVLVWNLWHKFVEQQHGPFSSSPLDVPCMDWSKSHQSKKRKGWREEKIPSLLIASRVPVLPLLSVSSCQSLCLRVFMYVSPFVCLYVSLCVYLSAFHVNRLYYWIYDIFYSSQHRRQLTCITEQRYDY